MKKHIRVLICFVAAMCCSMSLAAAGSYPSSGTGIPDGSQLLHDAIIGEEVGYGSNVHQGCTAAFDGAASTFYNPSSTGSQSSYCGIALADTYVLTQVCVMPRADWAHRLDGAQIQGSNDLEKWYTLYQFSNVPEEVQWNIVSDFSNNTGFRYFRYFNSKNHGDVAELEFYGYPGYEEPVEPYPSSGVVPLQGSRILEGELIGEEIGWGSKTSTGRSAAFDSDINTSYEATDTGTHDAWCGIACDQPYVLTQFCLYPRSGWENRVQNACLQGSQDQQTWVTLYRFRDGAEADAWTVVEDFHGNIGYKYYRYINDQNYSDAAEIELYGYPGNFGNDPGLYTTVVDVTSLRVKLESGDLQPAYMSVCHGGTYEGLPVLSNRDGKRFVGWYTAPEEGILIDENTTVTRLGNHTLYAHWE